MASAKKKGTGIDRLIGAGLKHLGLLGDEEARRNFYESACGKRYRSRFNRSDKMRVANALRAAGFAPLPGGKKPEPQDMKIRSLWYELRDSGALRDGSDQALLAYVEKRTGVKSLERLNPLESSCVIEQLKAWLKRVEDAEAARIMEGAA